MKWRFYSVCVFFFISLKAFDPTNLDTQEGFYFDEIELPREHPDLSGVPTFVSDLLVDEDQRQKKQENQEIGAIMKDVVERNNTTLKKQAGALAANASRLKKFINYTLPPNSKMRLRKGIPRVEYKENSCVLEKYYNDPFFTEKKISLFLKKVPRIYVVELIGKLVGINISIEVSDMGVVENISFKDVTLKAALKALLDNVSPQCGLFFQDGVYRIMHLKDALECAKQRQLLATDQEVVSSLRELNHIMLTPAARHRIEKMWHALLSSDASPKGSFLHIDEVSKKIFYRAKRSYVYDFEKFLNEIDLPIPQVIIEARLVITHKNFEESFGAQWSSLYNRRASIKHGIEFIGSGPLTDINNNPQPQQLASLMDWALNFFPDSALCGRTIKVPLVFGGNDLTTKRLNLVLNAAESRDELKTILKPRIITNHGEEAEILVGQNVPIETVVKETIEGSLRDIDTASYRDVGVKLRVKPFVLSDHASIFMDIYIENSKQVPEGKFPLINTTRSKNRVILKNGQTTMISGLIEDSSKDASTHMPFISKIPLLGWFFKGHRKSVSDSQMLIFITPTLL